MELRSEGGESSLSAHPRPTTLADALAELHINKNRIAECEQHLQDLMLRSGAPPLAHPSTQQSSACR